MGWDGGGGGGGEIRDGQGTRVSGRVMNNDIHD